MNNKELVIDGVTYVPKNNVTLAKAQSKKGLEFCIVRTYSAGVFAGWFDRKTKGKEGTVYGAIRVWYWKGANSLSDLATKGSTCPSECKLNVPIEVDLKEIIEVIPCTEKAKKFFEDTKKWEN